MFWKAYDVYNHAGKELLCAAMPASHKWTKCVYCSVKSVTGRKTHRCRRFFVVLRHAIRFKRVDLVKDDTAGRAAVTKLPVCMGG